MLTLETREAPAIGLGHAKRINNDLGQGASKWQVRPNKQIGSWLFGTSTWRLPRLFLCLPQPCPDAVDLIYSSLAAGGQLLIAGNGDRRPMRSTSLRNLRVVSCASGNLSGRSRCTSTRLLSPRSETITGMNMCLPASFPPMPGRAMCFWRSRQAVIARISCARLRRLVRAKSPSLGSRVNRGADASGMRPLSVRSFQIDGANSGNAHHDRPRDLRASGREAGRGMKQNLEIPRRNSTTRKEGEILTWAARSPRSCLI